MKLNTKDIELKHTIKSKIYLLVHTVWLGLPYCTTKFVGLANWPTNQDIMDRNNVYKLLYIKNWQQCVFNVSLQTGIIL